MRWLFIAAAIAVAVWWFFFRRPTAGAVKPDRRRFGVLPGGQPMPSRLSGGGPDTVPLPGGRGDLA